MHSKGTAAAAAAAEEIPVTTTMTAVGRPIRLAMSDHTVTWTLSLDRPTTIPFRANSLLI